MRNPVSTERVALTSPDLIPGSQVLGEEFYSRDAALVARECLGKILAHGKTAGRIVETEAYLGTTDLAAHASRGITERTKVLFGPPGRAYVYFIYGMHECLNFVSEPEGRAGCVLIRALQPLSGIETMFRRRPKARRLEDLTSGPAKLTQALAITRKLNGSSLIDGPITVRRPMHESPIEIDITPRIGITHCADWPLRFVIAGSLFASR